MYLPLGYLQEVGVRRTFSSRCCSTPSHVPESPPPALWKEEDRGVRRRWTKWGALGADVTGGGLRALVSPFKYANHAAVASRERRDLEKETCGKRVYLQCPPPRPSWGGRKGLYDLSSTNEP